MDDFPEELSTEKQEIDSITNVLENRVALGVLKDVKSKLEELHTRIDDLNNKIENIEENTIKNWPEQQKKDEVKDIKQFYPHFELLNSRISELENKFEERIPTKVLSEAKFNEEIQDGNDVVNRIVSEFKNLVEKKPMTPNVEGKLSIVESKRIEKIISLLEDHKKLSSTELSDLIGLSRTRCNEYFKLMESMNMVKPILVRKKKYYTLKSN
jgi:hypothetical protein